MNNKNQLTPIERVIRIASVMMAIAVVGIFYACFRMQSGMLRTVIITVCIADVLLALLFLVSFISAKHQLENKKNLFLYEKRGDISVDELDFERVRAKTLDYMTLFKRGPKLYVGEMFADRPWTVEEMKTLLCYELLYELSAKGNVEACKTFLGYGDECAKIFSTYLTENRDFDFCAKIVDFFREYKENGETAQAFSEYICSQKQHIEAQMLTYAKKNIEKFLTGFKL